MITFMSSSKTSRAKQHVIKRYKHMVKCQTKAGYAQITEMRVPSNGQRAGDSAREGHRQTQTKCPLS